MAGKSFHFSLAEFSGALADLGVMLPLVLALISLNRMNATAAFVGIGLAYIFTALVYRLPVPVQPLKSVSALALALGLPPVLIVTGAIWNTVTFLGMRLVGADRWVKKAFPKPVVRGIQMGLAYLLFKSAWKLVTEANPGWEGSFSAITVMVPWNVLLLFGAGAVLLIFLKWRARLGRVGRLYFWCGDFQLASRVAGSLVKAFIPIIISMDPQLGSTLGRIVAVGSTANSAQPGQFHLCHRGRRSPVFWQESESRHRTPPHADNGS